MNAKTAFTRQWALVAMLAFASPWNCVFAQTPPPHQVITKPKFLWRAELPQGNINLQWTGCLTPGECLNLYDNPANDNPACTVDRGPDTGDTSVYGSVNGMPALWKRRVTTTCPNSQPSIFEPRAVLYPICLEGFTPSGQGAGGQATYECVLSVLPPPPKTCRDGEPPVTKDPVDTGTGSKHQRSVDYSSASGFLSFARTYRSLGESNNLADSHNHSGYIVDGRIADIAQPSSTVNNTVYGDFGPYVKDCYQGTYQVFDVAHYIATQPNPVYRNIRKSECFPLVRVSRTLHPQGTTPKRVTVLLGNEGRFEFEAQADGSLKSLDLFAQLTDVMVGSDKFYHLRRRGSNSIEVFNVQGRLVKRAFANGSALIYGYSPDQKLVSVADHFGRTLNLAYTNLLLTSVADPSGQAINYSYGGASGVCSDVGGCKALTSVTYQDGASLVMHYDEPAFIFGAANSFLTGITDENGSRYATYNYYNSQVSSTEKAGGVEKHTYSYGYEYGTGILNSLRITDPRGNYNFLTLNELNRNPLLLDQTQPAGSGCAAATKASVFDANANATQVDDFKQNRTCRVFDTARNLEILRLEGLTNVNACTAVTLTANSPVPAGARKVASMWHPDWRMETKTAEPGRITSFIYNGQPDPFATPANSLASCAPATALLPDGKPIVVLCKKVEQATTDATGALAFTAANQSGVTRRVWTWTYNALGQTLTAKGPRTDVNDTTTYAYYAATTASATLGDLQTMTNAVGRTTQYTSYNKHGQGLAMTDPNGVVTTSTYDLRQRLTSTSIGGQTTTITYDLAGQLLKVTAPDASWIGYEYDAAQRLTAVKDHLGNRIDYTLDAAGSMTAQTTKDPGNALRRQMSQVIDALGRVQQTTGGR
jgi:YD repeat-containing protein